MYVFFIKVENLLYIIMAETRNANSLTLDKDKMACKLYKDITVSLDPISKLVKVLTKQVKNGKFDARKVSRCRIMI